MWQLTVEHVQIETVSQQETTADLVEHVSTIAGSLGSIGTISQVSSLFLAGRIRGDFIANFNFSTVHWWANLRYWSHGLEFGVRWSWLETRFAEWCEFMIDLKRNRNAAGSKILVILSEMATIIWLGEYKQPPLIYPWVLPTINSSPRSTLKDSARFLQMNLQLP